MRRAVEAVEPLVWEADVPLVTSGYMLRETMNWIVLTYVVSTSWIAYLFAVLGDAKAIPPLAGIFAVICGVMFVAALLIMLVFFGNRMRMHYVMDARGVGSTMITRRGRAAGTVAAAAGALAGQPGVTGAGMLAAAQQTTLIGWPAVVAAAFDDANRTIVLRGAWRRLGWIVCTEVIYPAAKERVQAELTRPGRVVPASRGNPLYAYVLWTVVLAAAAFPLFRLPHPYELEIFVILVTLAFALAGLWLIPLLAWAAVPGTAYALFVCIVALAKEAGDPGGSDFSDVALGLGGTLVLAFVCFRLVRGVLPSALMAYTDAANPDASANAGHR